MKTHDALLVISVFITGCAFAHPESYAASQDAAADALSICELVANGAAEGVTARVVATYKTDKSHYAYLFSDGCGKNGVLNVGDLDPISEATVKRFYDAGDLRCAKQGTPYVCVMEAKIDADIKVIRGKDGKLAAGLLKVHKFSFIEPST